MCSSTDYLLTSYHQHMKKVLFFLQFRNVFSQTRESLTKQNFWFPSHSVENLVVLNRAHLIFLNGNTERRGLVVGFKLCRIRRRLLPLGKPTPPPTSQCNCSFSLFPLQLVATWMCCISKLTRYTPTKY